MSAVRPAIYVASLTDYNNGVIHGVWIDATLDPAAVQRLIAAMLATSPLTRLTGEPAEEWAIHDHEGFGDTEIDPHESLEDVHALALIAVDKLVDLDPVGAQGPVRVPHEPGG